jgi:hypothetical protein
VEEALASTVRASSISQTIEVAIASRRSEMANHPPGAFSR